MISEQDLLNEYRKYDTLSKMFIANLRYQHSQGG